MAYPAPIGFEPDDGKRKRPLPWPWVILVMIVLVGLIVGMEVFGRR